MEREERAFNVLVTLAGPERRNPRRPRRSRNEHMEAIKKAAPASWNILVPSYGGADEVLSLVREADAIIGRDVDSRMIEAAPRLRIIQHGGSGVDSIDIAAASRRGIYVCNSKSNSTLVAEHALALILAVTKDIVRRDAGVRRGSWESSPVYHLKGRKLGIIGFGAIGTKIAQRASAFEMRVIAIKRTAASPSVAQEFGLEFLGTSDDLERVLAESDIVVLAVPKTEDTVGMIGKAQLEKMRKGSFLINVSRGPVVDEQALVSALKSGHLAGAGLDVFEKEPMEPTNPLVGLGNVVLTPHIAGGPPEPDSEEWTSNIEFIVRNVERALAGEVPENVVNALASSVPGAS
jgi:phosphoglycerate dehydrogenase-like enzyme